MNNSFIENVNYVANLDNKYGRSVEIFKNNLSLRTESYSAAIKFTYYNNETKELVDIVGNYNSVDISGFNTMLLNFKSQILGSVGGNTFTCDASFTYTNFIINNVGIVNLKINSLDDNIKIYGLNISINSGLNEVYNINGIINDTLKILPSLALINDEVINNASIIADNVLNIETIVDNIDNIAKIGSVSDNINDVIIVADNIADVVTVGDNIASVNTTSNSIVKVGIVSDNISDIGIVSGNIDSVNTTSANIAVVTTVSSNIGNVNVVANNIVDVGIVANVSTDVTTVADSIGSVNVIANDLELAGFSNVSDYGTLEGVVEVASSGVSLVEVVAGGIDEVIAVGTNIGNVNSVAANETNINAVVSDVIPMMSEILLADDRAASALASANSADASASTASTKASDASVSASNALSSENKAEKWAEELEDVEVEVGKYSAKHWASKAEEFTNVSAFDISYSNTASVLTATNVQAAIDEIVIDTAGIHDAANITTGTLSDARLPASISSDITGNAATSSKWATSMTITLSGDVTGSVGIDGSDNVTITTSVAANSVTLGTDTTGNYVAGVTQGTGISVSGTTGEGWSPTITLTNIGAAGTYRSVTTDAQGRVTSGTNPATVSGYGLTDVYTKTQNDTSLALKVNNSEKGVANGVSTLDANGKVVLTQIPDSVLGQLEYMGVHNFTSMPTATQKGQYWIASTSGNGYVVGDWAVWNGSAFDKVDNTDAVATVAGRTGNVVLTNSDVGLANVDNTADSAKPVSTAQQTALNLKANLDSPTFTGTVTAPTFSGELSGNATSATTATKLNASGGYGIQSLSSGISYSNAVCMREAPSGFGNSNDIYAPRLGFNWGGMAASSIALRSDGGFKFVNNPGTAYENVYANIFYGSLFGNADTATKLQTAITINGVSFDGSANITVSDTTKLPLTGGTMTGAITAIRETKVAMADNNIDLATGNLFTKTISGVTTFTVSNVLASGNVNSFILELTNGGSSLISWFAGAKWSNGTIPVLTAAGIDVLGFYTYDGGVTWKGKVIDKDVK